MTETSSNAPDSKLPTAIRPLPDALDPIPAPPGNPLRTVAVVIATLILAAVVYYFGFHTAPPAPSQQAAIQLPFGADEQAYASKLELGNFAMSRAENYLHQEVTYLDGDIRNNGDRTLRNVAVTVEFQDELQQIALRDSQPVLPGVSAQLAPGQTAHFQISFDHVPASWNMQMPSVRVTGIQFVPR